jgi:hypothetical protein
MFSKIWNYLVNVELTVEHDVEAIISTFNNTVEKLEAAAEAKAKEAERHLADATYSSHLSATATYASEKATKVAGQIKALVS